MAIIEPAQHHERQAAILERIATNAPLQGTLDALVGHVEAQIPDAIGALLLNDADGRRLRSASARHLPESYRAAVDGIAIGPDQGSCGTAAYLREPVFATDIASDPLWTAHRDVARSHGLCACWSVPILSRRPERIVPLGTFAVYFRSPAAPEACHRDVLAHAEYLACIALATDNTLRELRESEARLRMLAVHTTDGFLLHPSASDPLVQVNRQTGQH